jgi:beta-N-acetylhexosaminidase
MMKSLRYSLLIILVLGAVSAFAQAKFEPSAKSWKWADKQLKKMTVDEKIGQTFSIGVNAKFWNQNNPEFQEIRRQIVENKVGGIIFFASPVYEAVHINNRMQALAKLPLLISADFETGVGMRFEDTINFPWNMAVAATGDPELARRQGAIVGREAKAMGVYHVFAPVADVNNNSDNPVINVRSYGEDPQDVARFASAFTIGLQSAGVLATAKHFPGHGDTNVDSHRGLPIINLPRSRLDQLELAPFRAVINAGIGSIMVAHISLPQIDPELVKPLSNAISTTDAEAGSEIVTESATIPATLSAAVNQGILRKDLNFNGLIVTDALSMSGLTLYFQQDEAAVRAFLAGADMLLKPADNDLAIKGMKTAVASGRVTPQRLDESARKILAWKHEMGLARNRMTALDALDTAVSGVETQALTDEIATKAVTLVRNSSGLLPMKDAGDKRVFLLGITNGEDRNYIANAFLRTLRQNGARKLDAAVLDFRSSPEEAARIMERAKKSDVVIAALYGRVRSGASNSVGLPETGVSILRQLLNEDFPLVGVSFGNPYFLNSFPQMKTYVAAYGDMASLQRAVGRGITGNQPFTGKLPITLPGLAPRGTGIQLTSKQ